MKAARAFDVVTIATRVAVVVLAELIALPVGAGGAPPNLGPAAEPDPRRSGFDSMSPALQAMQRDDAANPAMLWVQDGAALWPHPAGRAAKSCADCHGAAERSLRGVAARYPAFDAAANRVVDLRQRLQQCRTSNQGAAAWATESAEQLGIEAYVARQSRGLPIAPPADARLQPARERGEKLFRQRHGQLDFSCAQCHDQRPGGRLAGSTIPEAHPTGYPLYRLEWQGLGSLQRRLRGCMSGVRAEPFAYGAPEWVDLEAYLMQRAAGMAFDAPGVRP